MPTPLRITIDDNDESIQFVSQSIEAEFQERAERIAQLGVERLKEALSVQYVPGNSSAGDYLFRRDGDLVAAVRMEVSQGLVEWGILDPDTFFTYWTDPERGAARRKGMEDFLDENFQDFNEIMEDSGAVSTEGENFVSRIIQGALRSISRFFR